MATYATQRRLYRMREGAYAGGVCAGLAEYFELDTIVVRILAILLAMLTAGFAVVVYLAMWVLIPLQPEQPLPYDVKPESAESSAFGCVDCDEESKTSKGTGIPVVARLAVAVGLMALFLAVAMGLSPLVSGTRWWQFWPLGLLMIGLCFIIIPIRTRNEALWHVAGIVLTASSASILPMSLGIMSWSTIVSSLQQFWPLLLVAFLVFAVGFAKESKGLMLAAAFLFVAFCLVGLMVCVVPGEVDALLFHSPTGHSISIAIA